ncbi:very short patch repair endonuclease [Halpernia frigidisoli]|uniref:Very short patch repair endonuclease n=1 Tax=Halpernia frigidisoli TaxID=1125876 RepID=A0A1I3G1V6_9FLAO|nr:very short patch repair endonuclease [Halpernia frigidisoli]SFI17463.1 T/G mismatch-specific endonuclease [Halpernia frigidisoli]
MADVHTKEQRSFNMSKVRSSNTKPEVKLRKALFAERFRYSLHNKKLPGKPDIVLRKYKTIIQVNGCFWHGHEGCRYFIIPKTRTEFWTHKITGTANRDKINNKKLTDLGWKVITVWECDLKTDKFEETLLEVFEQIKNES